MKGLFPWLFALFFGSGRAERQCTGDPGCRMWRDLRCGSGCCAKHCARECKSACLRADAENVPRLPPSRAGVYR